MHDDSAPLYADRDSINPRAFAVRHMVIEAVKSRLRLDPPQAAQRDALERVARGISVDYDSATRAFVVRLDGVEARRIPLDGLVLYHRGDSAGAVQRRGGDVRHWDAALEENRRVINGVVDALLRRIEGARA